MSYATIEAALKTVLQAGTSPFLTDAQVTRGDWQILDAGVDTCVILYPGPFEENGFGANNTLNIQWTVNIQLVQRVTGTVAEAITSFITLRDTVRAHIQKYPTLGISGVVTTFGLNGAGPEGTYNENGDGPFHIIETLSLQVQEENQQTLA